jgi:hypothetical protein
MRALSLGAGVQSSTLALMCALGDIPAPEVAVFADTQDEPDEVYDWLNWLEKQLPFPIRRVSQGKLSETALQVRQSAAGNKYLKPMIPVYIDTAGKRGMAMRHCTKDFKVDPILRALRHIRDGRIVHQYLGISFDELERMKVSQQDWLHNEYPLVERRITRPQCIEWMRSHGFPDPPRSACKYCPFHSNAEWRRLSQADFAEAIAFEKRYQAAYAKTELDGIPYLHSARIPLEEVDFSESSQIDAFGNECEGLCGV